MMDESLETTISWRAPRWRLTENYPGRWRWPVGAVGLGHRRRRSWGYEIEKNPWGDVGD
jgi:hypothetical protein